MRNNIYKTSFYIFFISLFLSCNKSSIIEGVGPINSTGSNSGGSTATQTGSVTIKTENFFCNSVSIYVDGSYKGAISPTTDNVACGTNSSKAITVKLPVGSHTFTASGGTRCNYNNRSFTIERGKCLLITLN